jgi:hypothetical protein
MSRSGYGRRLTDAEQTRARAELTALADDLGCIARGHDAKSAMVRVWVDHGGRMHAAANLYTKSAQTFIDASAALEFRCEMGA